MVLGGFTLQISLTGEVDDVDEHIGLVEVREELVSEPFPLVCAGNEAGHVDEFRRDEPDTLRAVAVVGRAGVVELRGGTVDADVRLAHRRVDCRERVRALGHVVHRRRIEKRGLADRGLPTSPIL